MKRNVYLTYLGNKRDIDSIDATIGFTKLFPELAAAAFLQRGYIHVAEHCQALLSALRRKRGDLTKDLKGKSVKGILLSGSKLSLIGLTKFRSWIMRLVRMSVSRSHNSRITTLRNFLFQ